jgi:alkyl hydroperoxide reductase subunit AhpC
LTAGDRIPAFDLQAVVSTDHDKAFTHIGDQSNAGKWKMLFFWPKDFTSVVDPEGVIRFVSVNHLSVGRNPQEVLRVLDALQTDELCPCNWQKGEEFLKAARTLQTQPLAQAA